MHFFWYNTINTYRKRKEFVQKVPNEPNLQTLFDVGGNYLMISKYFYSVLSFSSLIVHPHLIVLISIT